MKKKRTKAQRVADAQRTGRPPKLKGERKDYLVCVRVTADERKSFEQRAKAEGITLSEMILRLLRARN